MDNSSLLSRLPVLRLLLPMIAGILLYDACDSWLLPLTLVVMAIIMIVIVRSARKSPASAMRMRRLGMLPLAMATMAVGWGAAAIARPPVLELEVVNDQVACGCIESITAREKSMMMRLRLVSCNDTVARNVVPLHETSIALSTSGCDYELKAGDLVAFVLDLKPVTNMGNPDEMDYARFMLDNGVRYKQHTPVESVEKVGEAHTIFTRMFNYNRRLQRKIIDSRLEPATQALLIAMLLGNDDLIDRELREEFSLAGVAHVLALSGLHVGIITAMLWLLLFPLDYVRARKLRLLLTMAMLVAYDVMTGLSPSVVRATVMIAFVLMAMIFYRKSHPLNSLAVAALVILIFSPAAIYSVGFQLSFITVAAIVVFYRTFDIKFPSNKLLNYVCTMLATSGVAMISTIVLTAYYFNTVSPLAIVANLVVLPIVPVFMMCGVMWLLLLLIGAQVGLLNSALDNMASAINGAVGWLSSLPLSSSNVYVTWVAVIIYYIVIFMLVMWLRRSNARWLIGAGAMIAIGIAHSLFVDMCAEKEGMVIFNSRNSTPVLYFYHGNAMLWMPDVDEDFDRSAFLRRHRAFLAHHGIDSVVMVDSAECRLPGGVIKPPYAHLCGTSLVAVGKGRWKHYERLDSIDVRFDFLLVTKRFHSSIGTLDNLIKSDTILLSGDIYSDNIPQLQLECHSRQRPCFSISTAGAYVKMK